MGLNDLGALLEVEVPSDEIPKEAAELPLVLLVDDDSSVVAALASLLSSYYRVIVCSSATEAVAALNDGVSAVVLDIKMSDHDGFWACDQIRKKNAHLPVIFHSAYQDAKDPLDIINQHHPFGYITKGDVNELLETMARAIGYYQVILESKSAVIEIDHIRDKLQKLEAPIESAGGERRTP